MRPVDELAADLLRRGEPLRIKARGGSMLPFLRDGDVAVVNPVALTEIRVGDVVCYETSPGRIFLHRVVERAEDRIQAKGDALSFTHLVGPSEFLGRVVAIERRGRLKRLDRTAARWRGRIIASFSFMIPVLLPIVLGLRRGIRAARRG